MNTQKWKSKKTLNLSSIFESSFLILILAGVKSVRLRDELICVSVFVGK